ncbi:MAG: hypothetical protein KGZ59_04020 [Chitinophagaceae bacterium]|nr:hypothetical protein [Chitinophagaceae bacterium]
MNIEKEIEESESILKKIKQFEPDPYYVNYYFNSYLFSINNTYHGIFEEANRDFGLFISEYTKDAFLEKASEKNDQKALSFGIWFEKKYDEYHQSGYPNFIKKCCKLQNDGKRFPKIKIMINAKERYVNDPNQEIICNMKYGKIGSKEELQIEIRRQLPIFLEIINYKRKNFKEPIINKNQVSVSTFLDIDGNEDVGILDASKIYISVLKRVVFEAREKIKELTRWT